MNEALEGKNTPVGWCLIQDKCKMPLLESFPNSQDKTSRRRLILTTHNLCIVTFYLCIVTFFQISNLNLHEHGTSIHSVRVLKFRWKNSNETHLKLPQKTSHMEGVTSHGRCDLVSFFGTS